MEESLNDKQKDLDELYGLLGEREKEVEEANKYAESLLEDKQKLLDSMEAKDREIERLGQELFHKDQKLKEI